MKKNLPTSGNVLHAGHRSQRRGLAAVSTFMMMTVTFAADVGGRHDHDTGAEAAVSVPAAVAEVHEHKDYEYKDHEHKDHAAEKASATDHPGHEEHGHGHENGISVSGKTRREFGIVTRVAGGGSLSRIKRLTGEVVFNEDRYAHVVPRVPGFAREVKIRVGDRVKTDQLLAVLQSRELAEAKSRYLSALARMRIVEANHRREARLRRDKINTERALLEAEQALAQAEVERRSSERQLFALGLSAEQVAGVESEPDSLLTRYEIRAPIDGVVIARHIVVGEIIGSDKGQPPFVVADLSKVWVDLTVYARDIAVIEQGQTAIISTEDKRRSAVAPISWISPSLAESTRSATARVSLDNRDDYWRPGMFVNAVITVGTDSAAVVVPQSAVQKVDGADVVFVEREDAFVATPVTLGISDGSYIEVLNGLKRGQRYVAENAFAIKAETGKDAFGGHGHAH